MPSAIRFSARAAASRRCESGARQPAGPVLVEYRAPRRFAAVSGSAPAVPGARHPTLRKDAAFGRAWGIPPRPRPYALAHHVLRGLFQPPLPDSLSEVSRDGYLRLRLMRLPLVFPSCWVLPIVQQ